MASWTVSEANDTAMTTYKALRLAQDNVTLTTDEALAELMTIGSKIKSHGNRFV